MNTGVMQKSSVEQIKVHLAEQFSLSGEQVDVMLPSFLATLGSHMEKLETALAENNPILLGKIGHTIKGAFLNLGMDDCARIAFSIEEKGKQGKNCTDFKKLVEDLRLHLNPVLL